MGYAPTESLMAAYYSNQKLVLRYTSKVLSSFYKILWNHSESVIFFAAVLTVTRVNSSTAAKKMRIGEFSAKEYL